MFLQPTRPILLRTLLREVARALVALAAVLAWGSALLVWCGR
jgi:hypothetical protein